MDYRINEVAAREIVPGFHGRFMHTKNMTIAFWDVEAGSPLPEHQHVHEQILNVIEGELEFTMDNDTRILKAGTVVTIESNVPHAAKALTDCKLMDVFTPCREEFK
jgi:quercetin dioxygenase-like cupin family protein